MGTAPIDRRARILADVSSDARKGGKRPSLRRSRRVKWPIPQALQLLCRRAAFVSPVPQGFPAPSTSDGFRPLLTRTAAPWACSTNSKRGLTKTASILNTDVRDLFKSEGRLIDETFLDEMRAILFKTDMGYESAEQIVAEVAKNFRGRVVQLEDVVATWKAKLGELMAQDASPIRFAESGPTVIMVCGVNGAGKTTSIAKLAAMFKAEGKSVLLGAGDTFRAAAVEQLTIWSQRLGVEIVTGEPGAHPASVAYRAVEQAVEGRHRRLHRRHRRPAADAEESDGRADEDSGSRSASSSPTAPHEVLLVLDATTGQNGISQAANFTQAVDCTGIVLAKLDGTAKGGVVVAIRQQVGLPVKYIGVGEKAEDLALFQPAEFVDALFAEVGADGAGSDLAAVASAAGTFGSSSKARHRHAATIA